MCGIAGVIGPAADAAEARGMIEAIAHRGPDGVRVERVGDDAVLAHARLSIIDLECGWQPLTAAGSTVIGNGEIYNYVELIEAFGLECRTGSDFEPLLHLYALEGERAFARLRGMYAFCLIGGDGRTWLVRDPFGIKPLYAAVKGRELRFASEVRSLPIPPPLGDQGAVQLLTLGYRVEDYGLTILPSIAPGAVLEWAEAELQSRAMLPALPTHPAHPRERGNPGLFATADEVPKASKPRGHVSTMEKQAWAPAFAGVSGGEGAWLGRLDAVLEDSVAVHQRSDVPYGLFLSGESIPP